MVVEAGVMEVVMVEVDVDAGVDFGILGLVGHYETVQAAGFEELIVHPVEESVCPTRNRYW